MAELTPFQTVGPFFSIALPFEGGGTLAHAGCRGRPISIEGTVTDGAGAPVPDALIEVWQANADGKYPPNDPTFDGFGRVPTDEDGHFLIDTIKPGPVIGPDGRPQAPHLLVGVLARGILPRLVTRVYFADEPANESDGVLMCVPPARRQTLIAVAAPGNQYHFDIRIQGERETVFFDVTAFFDV